MFLLVPQAKLRKRLYVARAAERWSAELPALIEQQLRAERSTHDAQLSPPACPQFGGCSVMIDLAQRSEPYEIALPYGLSVTVKR
jgi:hypothetical protein